MLKFVILIAVAYMLWRMFESEKRKKQEKAQREQEELVTTGVVVKDPVCGTYVDAESALSVREGDVVHHFCSYECRDAFLRKHDAAPQIGESPDQERLVAQPSSEDEKR